jgi:6-phosphogluconolactonase
MSHTILESTNPVDDAVALIEREAGAAIAARGRFTLSLSGGNTPKPVYAALAKRPHDWAKWLFTFGDERCVPPDQEESNFHMVNETWFRPAGVPAASILRMKGELDPPAGARDYADALRAVFQGEETPVHDLVLLGMGPDGHTASLFPETPALQETRKTVVENYVPKVSMWRLTLTYPVLNAARHVCFLLSKKGKEPVLDEVLQGRGAYPCLGIKPTHGTLTWLIGE